MLLSFELLVSLAYENRKRFMNHFHLMGISLYRNWDFTLLGHPPIGRSHEGKGIEARVVVDQLVFYSCGQPMTHIL